MSGRIEGGQHDWLGYLQPTGLVVAPAVLSRLGLWPEPQGASATAAAAEAVQGLAGGNPWSFFSDLLGWPADLVAGAPGGPPLPEALRVLLRDGETLLEPHWGMRSHGETLLVRFEAPDTALDRRGALDGWEASPQQRFERLLRETGALAGVLVGAGETGRREEPLEPVLRLVVAPKGEASGWLTWPLDALGQVSGRAMLAGLKLLLDRHALVTGAPSHRLFAVLAGSRAAQAEVSTRLAPQVLAALHELLRGFDAAAPDLVRDVAARTPHRLYEGLLTVLLRLIFILYAEDRDLMPSHREGGGAILYEQGYALGALHVRLLDDHAANPDVMDERRGAWGRLLVLFRLVGRGAEGFMQARGGKLFDEDAFPFLLGRVSADEPERVLPISDGCVLRVLDGLLTLDGERVAYRSLSVEQIGSVYETAMGFTVECAGGPMLAIRAGKNNKVPVWVDLAVLAAARGAERLKLLKERTGRGTFPAAVGKAVRAAGDVPGLAAALAPVVDARASPRGAPVKAGTPILQPTDERRRTGSHYTPPSLSRPIVAHALEPAFARIGADATPDDVLDLKVCDPAVGSGALLVEACRQLGARLVEAWERWPAARPTIPPDEDALLHAKRLVAQHCLHGVDRNPLALDLAKLSLWLETLARDQEFTFLDHVLRAGDSLVGLPNPKITSVTWGKVSAQHSFIEAIVRDGIRAAGQLGRLMRAEAEIAPYAVQAERNREARVALERAHLVADAILEAFFAGRNAREREANLAEVQQLVLAPSPASWARLEGLRERLRGSPIDITSFHWELEFDGVFNRANPGFDAIVGNPPFAGKNTVISGHPTGYLDWLKTLHPGAHGNADLSAHFFRRAFGLLRRNGAFGLIATNTIRQGDSRETGLAKIIGEGGTIYRAVSRHQWEGEAAVVVAQVFVRKGGLEEAPVLDNRPVRRISAYLVEGELDGSPLRLNANAGLIFNGTCIVGVGFTFDDTNAARGLCEPRSVGEVLSRQEVLKPFIKSYLGGDEVNNDPLHNNRREIIDFGDMPLRREEAGTSSALLTEVQRADARRSGHVPADYSGPVAADYPELLGIVRKHVKPARDTDNRDAYRLRWWQFAERRAELYPAIAKLERILAIPRVSPHLNVAILEVGSVFSEQLLIVPLSTHAAFATLQSRVHEVWARSFASTLEDRLRYTPSDCFETFPLPPGYADAPSLEAAGQNYHDHRATLMIARDQGMTPTYNRFHKPADQADDIAELRRLHADMDCAVLRAYGWDDLADAAAPVFLDAESETDHTYQCRLFWPAAFRDDLLTRLLQLNEARAREERL